MKVSKLLFALVAAVAGCASVSVQPLIPSDIDLLKSAKTAVIVFDTEKTISYDNTNFYGVGAALSKSTATYAGFFDLEKSVGDLLSKRFNERGLRSNVQQFPATLWTPELVARYADVKGTMVGQTGSVEIKQSLPHAWKEFLSSKGYDFLILSVVPGIGVTATNFDRKQVFVGIATTTYLYDVKKGILVWSNTISSGFGAPIQNSPKDVESNDFATINEVLVKSIDFFFVADRGAWKGFDVGMGLKPRS